MKDFKEELDKKICIALGEASMCWSETPEGIFLSEKALLIAENLKEFVFNYLDSLPKLK